MKLRNLNGAIRKHKGGVFMFGYATLPIGSIRVEVVKGSLLAALAEKFPDPTAETGLLIDADGVVSPDPPYQERATPDLSDEADDGQIDLEEMLLGDGPPTFPADDFGGLLG